MGVKNASKFMHKVTKLSDHDIVVGLSHLCQQYAILGRIPVAVDASWVGHRFSMSKTKDPDEFVVDLSLALSNLGFIVTVVLDGKGRHHSKRASTERKAIQAKACIDARVMHSKLIAISKKLEGEMSLEARNNLIDERRMYHQQLRRAESKSRPLDPNFDQKIASAVAELTQDQQGPGGLRIVQSLYQADSIIAHGLMNQQFIAVIGSDSNFSFLSCGNCLQITDFRLQKQKKKDSGYLLTDITVASLNKEVLTTFVSAIRGSTPAIVLPTEAYDMSPFLNKIGPRTLSLVAACLGCDQIPKGISGFGPAKVVPLIWDVINDHTADAGDMTAISNEVCYVAVSDKIKKTRKVSDCYFECVRVSAMAFLYEPSVTINQEGVPQSPWHYMIGPPPSLPKYIKEFAEDGSNINIIDGPTINFCVGPGDGQHPFMESELLFDPSIDEQSARASMKCADCKRVVCLFCRHISTETTETTPAIKSRPNKIVRCLDCYSVSSVICLPFGAENHIPFDRMCQELEECGYEIPGEASYTEISELHLALVEEKQLDFFSCNKTVFPTHTSEYLDLQHEQFETICGFDFKDGGGFLRDNRLDIRTVTDILEIISQYVVISGQESEHLGSKRQKLHHVLPDIIVKFAEGSRISGGLRLLQRCVRHAFDPKMPTIEDASCHIVRLSCADNQSTGLLISTKVPPSFRSCTSPYGVKVLLIKDSIVACKCTCKAGSKGSNQHVDVHVLPVLYQLLLFLCKSLANHLLYEISQWWKCIPQSQQTTYKIKVHGAVVKLVTAAHVNSHYSYATMTLDDILNQFVLGTEQAKTSKQPKDSNALQPLRLCQFIRPVTEARSLFFPDNTTKSASTVSHEDDSSAVEDNSSAVKDNSSGVEDDSSAVEDDSSAVKDDSSAVKDDRRAVEDDRSAVDSNSPTPNYIQIQHVIDALIECLSSNVSSEFNLLSYVGYQLLHYRQLHLKRDQAYNPGVEKAKAIVLVRQMVAATTIRAPLPRGIQKGPVATLTTGHGCAANKNVGNKRSLDSCVSTRSSYSREMKKLKSDASRQGRSMYCAIPGCKNNNSMASVKLSRIAPVPKRPKGARAQSWKRYAEKCALRHEMEKRCELTSKTTDYRICNKHSTETITRRIQIETINHKGEKVLKLYSVNLTVPVKESKHNFNTPPTTKSRGVGMDRAMSRIGRNLTQQAKLEGPQGDLAHALLSLQQTAELMDNRNTVDSLINESVKESFGLSVPDNLPAEREGCKYGIMSAATQSTNNEMRKEPTITLETSCCDVQQRTGFCSMLHLLCFVIVVCDGDGDIIMRKNSELTWLEEWFYYFEKVWGRTHVREIDASKAYSVSLGIINRIAKKKGAIIARAREKWPRYASHDEDKSLRNESWNRRYKDARIIFWDTTDIKICQPENAELQRLTYSAYYGGNVGKGGVFIQLCGWLGTEELWTGAISDTEYFERSGILAKQQQYAASGNPFVNIVDKGFRSNLAAWRNGRQLLLQPNFAKSDRKFNTRKIINTAAVAADRSANERSVKVCKQPGFLQRGLMPGANVEFLCDTWLNWSFQANFMFKAVL